MHILLTILLAAACFIALMLLIPIFMRKNHYVMREIIIDAPSQKIYDYVKLLKNQDTFNRGAMTDANRKKEFKGTDGTVGYVYSWSGDKSAGQGEKEIMKLVEGKRVEAEIRFVKPMKVSAYIIMEMEPLSDNQTKLSWSNAGRLNYPINLLIPMMEKSVARDMDSSLLTLKELLEK